MTHRLDPPSPALGHTTGVPVEASLRSSLFSGLLFLLAWALAQLWRVGLQPKPRGEAKLVSPEAGAEEEESTFVQAPGPWPEVRRAWASPSPLPWAKQVRKEGDEGTAEGPTGCGSGEQKVHEGAARREKPGGRPAGPAQQDDGQGAEGAARDLLMGQRALWPGEGMVDENEDAGEQAPGAAEQSPPSHVDGGPQGLWPLAWQLREEADKRGMGGAEESNSEGGVGRQPPVLTSPLLRAWAYRPGEDEDEDEEDVSDGEGGAGSPLLRAWACQPEEENEDQEDAKGETVCNVGPGLQTFRVSIFVPGAERPPPWPSPQLPQRLKRRLPPRRPPVELKPESPPGRKVRFSSTVELHLLVVWAGPAHAARRGPWEQLARDRSRFMRRIAQVEVQLGPFLCPDARARAWARLQAQTISPELRKPSSPPAVVLSSFQDGPCHPPSHPPSPSQ
uniref:Uncharacterized protein n=1 Tax=Vombatus ursinus TaxID=29139 RepID=A0A4X2KUX7_VOMUR